ncbi:hypothetical protein LY78DRAFT_74263 [Colletotrichum sublineola]|nr:hypothetical protein LY78DRAFT_74263 [Colletotrichum sublineola]
MQRRKRKGSSPNACVASPSTIITITTTTTRRSSIHAINRRMAVQIHHSCAFFSSHPNFFLLLFFFHHELSSGLASSPFVRALPSRPVGFTNSKAPQPPTIVRPRLLQVLTPARQPSPAQPRTGNDPRSSRVTFHRVGTDWFSATPALGRPSGPAALTHACSSTTGPEGEPVLPLLLVLRNLQVPIRYQRGGGGNMWLPRLHVYVSLLSASRTPFPNHR